MDAVFVFDEPTIGLHPLDVRVLLGVFDRLVASGATVVVIEHDLDVIASADWIIDMGPGGGESGGHIVATGTPEQVAAKSEQHHRAVSALTCMAVTRLCIGPCASRIAVHGADSWH